MDKRILMIAALALAAVACGDDSDDEGGVIIKTDGAVPTQIDASVDASVPSIDSSVPDSSTPNTVKGAPGCFSGVPTTSAQLLNACAEGYREFDNAKRIPGYVKGQLPPL
ncbi:MAG TPA: hypothetical protein VI299_03175 [Polyangiales bacterium]